MAQTVIRRGCEIKDGDEIVMRTPLVEENNDTAVVLEKTLAEDGSVTLLLNMPADAALVTKPRPAELTDSSGSPFNSTDLGDDPDGDLEGYDGA